MYTNAEMESMIDGFMDAVVLEPVSEEGEEEETGAGGPVKMKEYPQIWRKIAGAIATEHKTIPEIAQTIGSDKDLVTWHVMTMNKYNVVVSDGLDKKEQYYYYKLKI
ncbi:hypothetical protein SDC9_71259 [bioreactor metagenome]|uniref:MarR family transcriptional regulator n=1 Tax=bioreactor metagenome TaxID=1076179 RepID=A0A644YF85_9ZZZZ